MRQMNFKNSPKLKGIIENDQRLYFSFVRSRYNGPKFFQYHSINLIEVYDKNPNFTNDDLLLANLDYKWLYAQGLNRNSSEIIGRDVLKIAEIVGVKPPNKNVVV